MCRSQPLFCREQPAAGPAPSCPDQGGQHCENAVTTKKLEFAEPTLTSTQRVRWGPLGTLGRCARAPVEPESRSCGRAACSRENCALCGAEICTVISSAVRVVGCAGWKLPAPGRLPLQTAPSCGLNGPQWPSMAPLQINLYADKEMNQDRSFFGSKFSPLRDLDSI